MRPLKQRNPLWLAIGPLGIAAVAHAASPPTGGEIVFTELMIEPKITENEWIEVYSRASETVQLEGCVLLEGKSSTCAALGGIVGNCSTLTGGGVTLEIDPGERLLFAKGTVMTASCGITPAASYTKLTLNNDSDETLQLYCSNGSEMVSVASITYNSSGGGQGYSWQLDESVVTGSDLAAAQDFDANWLVTTSTTPYCTTELGSEFGSPGAVNEDPTPTPTPPPPADPPEPGSVIFSELSTWGGSSGEGPDWLELHVVGTEIEGRELTGCRLNGLKCDDGGFTDEAACLTADLAVQAKAKQSILKPTGSSLALTADGYFVLGSSSTQTCVSYTQGETEATCLTAADATWSGVTLYSTDTAVLALECPDPLVADQWIEIDRFLYNGEGSDASTCTHPDGLCSWELKNDAQDAVSNDDTGAWRYAGSGAPYLAYESQAYVTAFGTPRAPNVFGPLQPVAPGSVIFSELVIWPSTSSVSPDWLELTVIEPPVGGPYDLAECALQSYACEPGTSALDCAAGVGTVFKYRSQVNGAEDQTPQVEADEIFLLGGSSSKFCVETDATGACINAVRGSYGSTLGPSSTDEEPTRMIELRCPGEDGDEQVVDRVVFDYRWIEATCGQASGRCSWELRPGVTDDLENDDPRAWGAATETYLEPGGDVVRGTPGRENSVPGPTATAGAPGPGDVVFSELMVDPSDGAPEWLELQGVNTSDDGSPWELAGCTLIQVKGEDAGLCDPNGSLDTSLCKQYGLPGELNLPIAAGQQRLFVDDVACLSYGEGGDTGDPAATCLVPADVRYGGLDFLTSSAEVLTLWCPGDEGLQLIDAFRFDWSAVEGQCAVDQVAACSISVHPDHVDATSNDSGFFRCVSPAGTAEDGSALPTFFDPMGMLSAGSPGDENVCGTLARVPTPGAIVISELMIAPAGSDDDLGIEVEEWFELYNAGSEAFDLQTCSFVVAPVNPDGSLNTEKAKEYPQGDNPVSIGPQSYQVWMKDGCIATEGGGCVYPDDTGSVEDNFPLFASYSSMAFTASSPTAFQLWCRGEDDAPTLIDEMRYDYVESAIQAGHSWQAMPEQLSAEGNDATANWCEAGYNAKFYTSPNGEGNYGTPGQPNRCASIEPFDGPAPSCRCDAAGGQRGSYGHFAVTLLGMLGLARAMRRHRRS